MFKDIDDAAPEVLNLIMSWDAKGGDTPYPDSGRRRRTEKEPAMIVNVPPEVEQHLNDLVGDVRIAQLLQEAEDSGDYSEMTPADWEQIERDGLANWIHARLVSQRCPASSSAPPPLTYIFVWLAEEAGVETGRRFLRAAKKAFGELAAMPRKGPA